MSQHLITTTVQLCATLHSHTPYSQQVKCGPPLGSMLVVQKNNIAFIKVCRISLIPHRQEMSMTNRRLPFVRHQTTLNNEQIAGSYAYWTVHHLDIWIKVWPTRWHLLYYLLLNMFQTLIRPSSGAIDYLLRCVGWLEACWCYVAGLSVGDMVSECRLNH